MIWASSPNVPESSMVAALMATSRLTVLGVHWLLDQLRAITLTFMPPTPASRGTGSKPRAISRIYVPTPHRSPLPPVKTSPTRQSTPQRRTINRQPSCNGSSQRPIVLLQDSSVKTLTNTTTLPTALHIAGWRFHFYSDEATEPPHIHVDTGDGECKFRLDPVRLARSQRVSPVELRRIESTVFEHHSGLLGKWHDHFRN